MRETETSGGKTRGPGTRAPDRARGDRSVREVCRADAAAWARMRYALWPEVGPGLDEEVERFFRGELREPLAVFVAQDGGRPRGFAEFSVRAYAEGCVTDAVAYLEGFYVEPAFRGSGLGRALVEAGERWARGRGCVELASDAVVDNRCSAAVHARLGFDEVATIRCFRKALD